MRRQTEVAILCGVSPGEIGVWVEQRWLRPLRDEDGLHFSEVDTARARLIAELERDLGIAPESMPVVLSLLDQIHTLRRRVRVLSNALLDLPDETRAALCRRLLDTESPPRPHGAPVGGPQPDGEDADGG
ncbi:chaperone modulator CbpM [Oleisolibacter albus]|uniref:chaperone modulator CbpM n=1 Tax=Oleisolibacter albus TaxID=2171757 RepID=UPI000DF41298|nr:chaperone modulator CbpM [Oleisolibacter albus]